MVYFRIGILKSSANSVLVGHPYFSILFLLHQVEHHPKKTGRQYTSGIVCWEPDVAPCRLITGTGIELTGW